MFISTSYLLPTSPIPLVSNAVVLRFGQHHRSPWTTHRSCAYFMVWIYLPPTMKSPISSMSSLNASFNNIILNIGNYFVCMKLQNKIKTNYKIIGKNIINIKYYSYPIFKIILNNNKVTFHIRQIVLGS